MKNTKRLLVSLMLAISLFTFVSDLFAMQSGSPAEKEAHLIKNLRSCPFITLLPSTYPSSEAREEWWRRIVYLINTTHGYVNKDDFDQLFCTQLTASTASSPSHQHWTYESKKRGDLSISLDVYDDADQLPYWKVAQGEMRARHSIVNIAGTLFGCMPLPQAKDLLTETPLVEQGSLTFKFLGVGSSRVEYASKDHGGTNVTLFYGPGVIVGPCVDSIRVQAANSR